jgi:hypothetical protein
MKSFKVPNRMDRDAKKGKQKFLKWLKKGAGVNIQANQVWVKWSCDSLVLPE